MNVRDVNDPNIVIPAARPHGLLRGSLEFCGGIYEASGSNTWTINAVITDRSLGRHG